jgi:hypothetical protein
VTVESSSWYGVRCLFDHGTTGDEHAYEERVTVWRANSLDEALGLAEEEAGEHAEALGDGSRFLGFAQAFAMVDPPAHGAEVFSLIRIDRRGPDDYLDAIFDTGTELQQAGE